MRETARQSYAAGSSTMSLLNICGPIGSGKTTFITDWAKQAKVGLQVLTPSQIGERIRASDQRFDFEQFRIFVFDEFHQWDWFALAETITWLFRRNSTKAAIQVGVVSQSELDVLHFAQHVGAVAKTIHLANGKARFNELGFVVDITQAV